MDDELRQFWTVDSRSVFLSVALAGVGLTGVGLSGCAMSPDMSLVDTLDRPIASTDEPPVGRGSRPVPQPGAVQAADLGSSVSAPGVSADGAGLADKADAGVNPVTDAYRRQQTMDYLRRLGQSQGSQQSSSVSFSASALRTLATSEQQDALNKIEGKTEQEN